MNCFLRILNWCVEKDIVGAAAEVFERFFFAHGPVNLAALGPPNLSKVVIAGLISPNFQVQVPCVVQSNRHVVSAIRRCMSL